MSLEVFRSSNAFIPMSSNTSGKDIVEHIPVELAFIILTQAGNPLAIRVSKKWNELMVHIFNDRILMVQFLSEQSIHDLQHKYSRFCKDWIIEAFKLKNYISGKLYIHNTVPLKLKGMANVLQRKGFPLVKPETPFAEGTLQEQDKHLLQGPKYIPWQILEKKKVGDVIVLRYANYRMELTLATNLQGIIESNQKSQNEDCFFIHNNYQLFPEKEIQRSKMQFYLEPFSRKYER